MRDALNVACLPRTCTGGSQGKSVGGREIRLVTSPPLDGGLGATEAKLGRGFQMAAILIEDHSVDDIALLRRPLETAGVTNPVMVVRDGSETVRYLQGDPPFHDRETYPLRGCYFWI